MSTTNLQLIHDNNAAAMADLVQYHLDFIYDCFFTITSIGSGSHTGIGLDDDVFAATYKYNYVNGIPTTITLTCKDIPLLATGLDITMNSHMIILHDAIMTLKTSMSNVPTVTPSTLNINHKLDRRIGYGANQSRHDMINLLKPYVSSEYDLISLRTRNDIIWQRMAVFDINTLTDTDATIIRDNLDDETIPSYKIVTSRWYIEISPISSGVNVLYNKFRKLSKDNIDDLRAIAQVVRTITKIINA